MQEIQIFNTQDLVLKVTKNYDVTRLNLGEWQRFLDVLCPDRDYQQQAIKAAIVYLFSGKYRSIEDVVKENYQKNEELQVRYKDIHDYYKKIQLPQRLSATIDLATGTGKSFVMYGIAQIALGLGLVDKVLVLCPSLTIEAGLMEKFLQLSTNARLRNTIPETAKYKNPSIVDATQTIKDGDVCIENIHAVYAKNSSSIMASLGFGKGATCLVLSDEVHHVYNKVAGNDVESRDLKKWKEFLLDDSYKFCYMLGFTGTAYIENEYFNDVIFRYSLRQAIEEDIVKTVFYVAKDEQTKERDEKFQKIYQNHQANKEKYGQVKALTILVTQTIQQAEQLKEELCEFLSQKEALLIEEVRQNKVLIVTSKHKENVTLYLHDVDDANSPFEWVISVSMLTEGWDVKNVFQIVPMEERAFNSKLLIAQVLGRGLRLPTDYPKAQVVVFNHDSWTGKIKKLVDEVLEIEMKLTASPISQGERTKYHFTLRNMRYERVPKEVPVKETQVFNYEKEEIKLQAQIDFYKPETVLENIQGEQKQIVYQIEKEMFSVESIVNKIYDEFRTREWEGVTLKLKEGEYTKNNLPPKPIIERIIRNSMAQREIKGDYLDRRNRQIVFSMFNTLLRKKPKSITYERLPQPYFETQTLQREHERVSIGSLRRDTTSVFYTPDYETEIQHEESLTIFKEIFDSREFRGAFRNIYTSLFKTPIDLVFTASQPEENFVKKLCHQDVAQKIKAWFKSRSQAFYEISYSITTDAGKHSQQKTFNPDFFIQMEHNDTEYIIVVEIKTDGDDSDENKAKYRYGKQHFSDLNAELAKNGINQRYIFHFLSPSDYQEFFGYLQDGRLIADDNAFTGELEILLDN